MRNYYYLLLLLFYFQQHDYKTEAKVSLNINPVLLMDRQGKAQQSQLTEMAPLVEQNLEESKSTQM